MDNKAYKKPHSLYMEDRKKISLKGVVDVGAFDEENISVYTDFGEVKIKGEKLQVSVIDTDNGQLEAEGKIISVVYSENYDKKHGFLKKVFR